MSDTPFTTSEESRRAMAADLESLEAHGRKCLSELETIDLNELRADDAELVRRYEGERLEWEEGLAYALRTMGERLLLYTEAFSLRESRRRVQRWLDRWSAHPRFGGTKTWANSEADGRESAAFEELRPVLDGFLLLLRPGAPPTSPIERRDRERLEYCLRALAKTCLDRKVYPATEHEVQAVMHSHLSSVFDDYTKTLTISKPLASFKPDGGVVSLKSAIECKFVASPKDLPIAARGLTEDLSGYSGSSDWTQFYTVVYMTAPYAAEGQFHRALELSGNASSWTTIVVTGVAAREPSSLG